MATMTHPSTFGARSLHRASAPARTQATVDISEMKGSLLYAIGACAGILGVSLATVLMPALGPPSEEAAALIEAKQVQVSAREYLAMHPEDALPAADSRAWGFFVPETQSPARNEACPEYWVGSSLVC